MNVFELKEFFKELDFLKFFNAKKYERFVVFDTETSGTNFEVARIIECAATSGKILFNGEIEPEEDYDEFVKHEGLRVEEIMTDRKDANGNYMSIADLTHISDETLQTQGISEDQLVKDVLRIFFQPRTLIIAYNSNFDLNMFKDMLNRHGYDGAELIKSCDQLDLLTIFKDNFNYCKTPDETGKPLGHRLDAAVATYKVTVKNTHRAIDDVHATIGVLAKMINEGQKFMPYINVFGYNPKFVSTLTRIDGITYYPQPYHPLKQVLRQSLQAYYSTKNKPEETAKVVPSTKKVLTKPLARQNSNVDVDNKQFEDKPTISTEKITDESRIVTAVPSDNNLMKLEAFLKSVSKK